MNSFKVSAIGNLAKDPSLVKKGGKEFCRFCLVGNDYSGKDEHGEATEVTTAVWFVAFNGMAKAIGNARKGDQLVVDAHIRANNYQAQDSDETVYDYSYIVDGFRFGAPGKIKREELAHSR